MLMTHTEGSAARRSPVFSPEQVSRGLRSQFCNHGLAIVRCSTSDRDPTQIWSTAPRGPDLPE